MRSGWSSLRRMRLACSTAPAEHRRTDDLKARRGPHRQNPDPFRRSGKTADPVAAVFSTGPNYAGALDVALAPHAIAAPASTVAPDARPIGVAALPEHTD